MRFGAGLLTALCLSAGCQSRTPADPPVVAQDPPGPEEIRPLIPAVKVVPDDEHLLSGPSVDRLPLMGIRDLVLRVELPQIPIPQLTWVEVKFYTPLGQLFRDTKQAFTTDPTVTQTATADVPHPVHVDQAKQIEGGVGLDLSIPVGGTNLQRHPQGGLYRIVVSVEGGPSIEKIVDLWVAQ
jgi:hypothetical protein